MPVESRVLIPVVLSLVALAGCQSSRFDSIASTPAEPSRPAPLTAAPTPGVQQGQLPPPSGPSANTAQAPQYDAQGNLIDPNATGTGLPGQDTQVASLPPSAPAANAAPVTKNAVVGNWQTSAGGSNCQMFLTLTSYGNASRGGTRGCPGDLANLRGWDVAGNQIVLYDDSGNTIGRLSSSGPGSYSGQTNSGTQVTLTR